MERLTLDMTAIRDLTDPSRSRHEDGLALLALAATGEVELGIPPQGALDDLAGQYTGALAGAVNALASQPGVVRLRQLAWPSSVTFPSASLLPGHVVHGLGEAWDQVATTWKSHTGAYPGDQDRWYVETHIAEGRDLLVTDDRALAAMCRRLREEHGFPVRTDGLADYVARRRGGTSAGR